MCELLSSLKKNGQHFLCPSIGTDFFFCGMNQNASVENTDAWAPN
jgi:hypothetical protein